MVRFTDLHELCPDWLDVVVQEVRLQVVHAELEGPEALADEGLGAIEGRDERVHQHVEVGEEGAGGWGEGRGEGRREGGRGVRGRREEVMEGEKEGGEGRG